MRTADFDFHLPKELIAQVPPEQRGQSRLMVLHKQTGEVEHRMFSDICDYFQAPDVLVVNDSKVIPARLYGHNAKTGGAIEILLVKRLEENRWLAMVHPGRRCRMGMQLTFGDGRLTAEVVPSRDDYYRELVFRFEGTWESVIAQLGAMPVPPYIKRSPENSELLALDKTRYQTVYAQNDGSIAAPTAGLHFTDELLELLQHKGVAIAKVTLHVGTGTFLPVKTENLEDHPMHEEEYLLTSNAVAQITAARQAGGRVISVGTTTTRVLESVADEQGNLHARSGATRIFIYPGYTFKIVDAMITNFHLPESTLLMLISAFADKDKIMHAYQQAVEQQYRFYSYGDAMLII
jgi:S-adenosylmethionine:tRNA ribosyltransferase-isomerase